MRGGYDQPRSMRTVMMIGVALLIGVVAWGGVALLWPEDDGKIALLRASNEPYKAKPEEAGGVDIPHQDKTVFNAVAQDGRVVTVERILPPPEQPIQKAPPAPVPVEQPLAAPVAAVAPAPTPAPAPVQQVEEKPILPTPVALGRAVAPPGGKAPAPAAHIDAPTTAAFEKPVAGQKPKVAVPVITPETAKPAVSDTTPFVAAPVEEPKKAAAPKEKVPAGKGRFQLASFTDRPSAEKAVSGLSKKYGSALDGASLFIAEASISGKGRVYRVQGSASDGSVAESVCTGIKAKGGTCVIVRR
jgi:hypothetical protein